MSTPPAERFYEDAVKRDFLVFRVCGYLRVPEECSMCPATEEHPDYGPCKKGCRALAEELIAVVAESLEKGEETLAQDNDPRPYG